MSFVNSSRSRIATSSGNVLSHEVSNTVDSPSNTVTPGRVFATEYMDNGNIVICYTHSNDIRVQTINGTTLTEISNYVLDNIPDNAPGLPSIDGFDNHISSTKLSSGNILIHYTGNDDTFPIGEKGRHYFAEIDSSGSLVGNITNKSRPGYGQDKAWDIFNIDDTHVYIAEYNTGTSLDITVYVVNWKTGNLIDEVNSGFDPLSTEPGNFIRGQESHPFALTSKNGSLIVSAIGLVDGQTTQWQVDITEISFNGTSMLYSSSQLLQLASGPLHPNKDDVELIDVCANNTSYIVYYKDVTTPTNTVDYVRCDYNLSVIANKTGSSNVQLTAEHSIDNFYLGLINQDPSNSEYHLQLIDSGAIYGNNNEVNNTFFGDPLTVPAGVYTGQSPTTDQLFGWRLLTNKNLSSAILWNHRAEHSLMRYKITT